MYSSRRNSYSSSSSASIFIQFGPKCLRKASILDGAAAAGAAAVLMATATVSSTATVGAAFNDANDAGGGAGDCCGGRNGAAGGAAVLTATAMVSSTTKVGAAFNNADDGVGGAGDCCVGGNGAGTASNDWPNIQFTMANGGAPSCTIMSKTDVAFFFSVLAEATAAPIGGLVDGIKGGADCDDGNNDDNDDNDGADDGDDEDVTCADWTATGGAKWYRHVVPLSAQGVDIGAALDNASGGIDDGTMDGIVTGTLSGTGNADCGRDVVDVDVDVEVS